MNTKLCLAAFAATLAAAPVAMAQTYQNQTRDYPMSESSSSAGNTQSPAVESLPGFQPDAWHDGDRSGNQSWLTRNRGMAGSSGVLGSERGMSGSSYPSGRSAMDNRDATGGGLTRGRAVGSSVTANSINESRRGPGQKPLELVQTTLLNRLSASGYSMIRDFRKEGDRYVANAMGPQGAWTTVELDPRSGQITQR